MLQPRICMLETKERNFLILTYETSEVKQFDVFPYMSGAWYRINFVSVQTGL